MVFIVVLVGAYNVTSASKNYYYTEESSYFKYIFQSHLDIYANPFQFNVTFFYLISIMFLGYAVPWMNSVTALFF